ncbi:MAG TPA: hypothetical protein VF762_10845 [Blastocatellia bacterium]|jgi:hypothetical protein
MMSIKTFRAIAITVAILFGASFSISTDTVTAKDKSAGDRTTSIDLDLAGAQGAQVFYQLTDDEGGAAIQYSNGSTVRRFPARITLDYTAVDGRRDAQGRKLYAVTVDRPPSLGGPFALDGVPFDSIRSPGTIDLIKAGDLVN